MSSDNQNCLSLCYVLVRTVICDLDYCNSLLYALYSMSDGLKRKLQSIWNAASWFITGIRQCEYITPVTLASCSATSGVQGRTPGPLVVVQSGNDIHINLASNSGNCLLWWASKRKSIVPCAYSNFDDKDFNIAGPHVWKSLPLELWQDMSYKH